MTIVGNIAFLSMRHCVNPLTACPAGFDQSQGQQGFQSGTDMNQDNLGGSGQQRGAGFKQGTFGDTQGDLGGTGWDTGASGRTGGTTGYGGGGQDTYGQGGGGTQCKLPSARNVACIYLLHIYCRWQQVWRHRKGQLGRRFRRRQQRKSM